MSFYETCVKLAAYLVCIGFALEYSSKFYWRISVCIRSLNTPNLTRSILNAIASCIPLISTVGITLAFVVYFEKGSISTLGLRYTSKSLTLIMYGATLGLACVTLMFVCAISTKLIRAKSSISTSRKGGVPAIFSEIIEFFCAALSEEIITRGYVFYVLCHACGISTAVVASSTIFSVAHMFRYTKTPLMFAVNAFIFGILTALCRYYTASLWLPIGLHFGWNIAAGPIYGLPYMGKPYERGIFVSEVSGPEWLTGGFYSPDAGVLGTLTLITAAIGLLTITPNI